MMIAMMIMMILDLMMIVMMIMMILVGYEYSPSAGDLRMPCQREWPDSGDIPW